MVGGPNSFARIERDWQAFCKKAEQCQSATTFDEDDYRDAISRLSRLRERCLKEMPSLTKPQAAALAKVFEKDPFIKGLMNGPRQISEHVQKRKTESGITIYTPDNTPIELDCETSAAGFFMTSLVFVSDIHAEQHRINHLQNLAVAKKRIGQALDNARPS